MAEDNIKGDSSRRQRDEEKEVKKIKDFIDEAEIQSEFYIEVPVTLQTALAKRLYKRVFSHLQTQATAAILLTRKFGLKELSNENVEKIDGTFKQLASELNNDMKYADAIFDDTGLSMDVSTPDSVDLTVRVTCPQGMSLLNLIRQFDNLAMKLKMLWMSNELPLANSEDRAYDWQVRIFKAADGVRALGQQAYIAAENKKQSDHDKAQRKREKRQSRQNDRRQAASA